LRHCFILRQLTHYRPFNLVGQKKKQKKKVHKRRKVDMCKDKLLYLNKFGKITQGGCSSRVQLSFGNFVLGLSEAELAVLKDYIPPLYEEERALGLPVDEKNIFLSPSISYLMLAFSLEELEGLMDLINQASIILEIQKIISED
jgi:hypothetical protein